MPPVEKPPTTLTYKMDGSFESLPKTTSIEIDHANVSPFLSPIPLSRASYYEGPSAMPTPIDDYDLSGYLYGPSNGPIDLFSEEEEVNDTGFMNSHEFDNSLTVSYPSLLFGAMIDGSKEERSSFNDFQWSSL